MKFLCDQCKAKYQIADEKVAGRTVRMKCRKCGHMIEVRAEVTESSVSRFPPASPEGDREQKSSPLATSLSAARPAPRPAPQKETPSALAGAFQRRVKGDDDDATIMAPAASIAFEASVTDEWYAAINGVPVGPVRLSELRTKVAAGQITEDTLVWQDGFEEWRPVKTITQLAAIVREAAGQRPLTGTSPPPATPAPPRAAPAAVKPSPAARQTAPIGPAPAAAALRNNVVPISRGAPSSGSAAVALAPSAPASSPVLAPAQAPAAAAQSNPFAGIDPFAAPAAFAPPAPAPAAAADPFAFGAPAAVPSADPFAFPSPQAEPVAAPAFAPAPAAPAPVAASAPAFSPVSEAPPPQERKKGAPLFFIAAVVLAAAFGITAAVLTFKKDPAPVAPVASGSPSVSAAGTAAPPPTATPTETVAQAEPDAAVAPTAQKVAMGGPKPTTGGTAATPSATAKTAVDLGSLGLGTGNNGASGPSGVAGGPSGPSAGSGQALDAASIQKTIGTYKAAVKRKCWDNAAATKPSANVQVSVTVAGSGSVTSASASGDDPAVAKCVENHVRGWHFDGGGQTVIPFHFVRQ